MRIIGLGTDIVEMARLKAALDNFETFRERVYTPAEQTLGSIKSENLAFYAGRWAAKEAASKALGCGIGEKCSFTDIEILNADDGRPVLTLSGAAAQLASSLGVSEISISISHERHYAVATVILSGRDL